MKKTVTGGTAYLIRWAIFRFMFFVAATSLFNKLPLVVKIVIFIVLAIVVRSLFVSAFMMVKTVICFPFKVVKKLWKVGCSFTKKTKTGVQRAAKVVSSLSTMSGEEFDKKFGNALNPQPQATVASNATAPAPASFIPSSLCKQGANETKAMQLATTWWEVEHDGLTGEDRLAEILAEVASIDPTRHTCILTEHAELLLPIERPVLSALTQILQRNGIAADLTDDDDLIVSWGQSSDGKEASKF